MGGRGGGRGSGGMGRRGSGRAATNRSHSRPVGAESPAAAAAARVSGAIHGLLAAPGITIAHIAAVLGCKPIDVLRWRRGGGVASYRRAEIEGKLARVEVVVDPETGKSSLELKPEGAKEE